MVQKAKILNIGREQIVLLPAEYWFDGHEVSISRDSETGDVRLSRRPDTWDGLFALYSTTEVPADFLSAEDRRTGQQDRDPFAR